MELRLLPLRFHFAACKSVRFPAPAANLLRGVLGSELYKQDRAAYARFFSPTSDGGPSGLRRPPRPFVLRAEHLNGRSFAPGETFYFDCHLFDLREPWTALLTTAFAALRGAALTGVSGLDRPVVVALNPPAEPVSHVRVEFLTPTELKVAGGLARSPEFSVLAARARDRISALRQFYGEGPLAIDFVSFRARAAAVRLTECNVRQVEAVRRSRASGQAHSLGGFVGEACYEGDLAAFLPYLQAAEWTGVGRQTSWGKGAIGVHVAKLV